MDNTLEFDIQKDLDIINDLKILTEILDIIRLKTDMGFAAITRVTEKEWIVAHIKDSLKFNFKKGDRLPLPHVICSEIKQVKKPLLIENMDESLKYTSHPFNLIHKCKSFAGVPIYKNNNELLGTLIVMDRDAKSFNTYEITSMLNKYACMVSSQIAMKETILQTNRELMEERRLAELRDTFIAILGHDLRNPVGTTRMISDILLKQSLPDNIVKQIEIIKSSSYRMQELIDTILDFAKGHIADGIQLHLVRNKNQLLSTLSQVVAEAKALDPSQTFKCKFEIDKDFPCDPDRLGELLSNLLSNAIKHGDRKEPIVVYAGIKFGCFEISVTNGGKRIPDNTIKNLFKPYYKEISEQNRQGLGLGLYIVSEIAKAHSGSVEVFSDSLNTTFQFKMNIKKLLSEYYNFNKTKYISNAKLANLKN
ncbi:GAF domain-containing sensor histidine kinase [Galbibacter pacificus]|uniref:histidine kinase n=1 Tax=Galbibacter pacificus TaxID=2996052 RepID=A0ABT6FPP3_9FLAO|nr:GAF domain-containing sensor histidine kinase [Galbibacter pacificus]MDG3582283.1 GAF domain-containing sensor histidine kinase [Galbibacter pacificus]MDG3585241.1 GAF domain-containing sensor histidine kinase [Galbibacter pacificus]